MNDVSLIGCLAREPGLITTDSGTDIANLRVAVDRRRRDDGAVFVDVKCFEAQARACAEHLAKGRQVAVSGRLEFDEWQARRGHQALAAVCDRPERAVPRRQARRRAARHGRRPRRRRAGGARAAAGPAASPAAGQAADRGAPAMTSPDRLDPLSLAGSLAYLEADVPLGLTLPAGRSQRTTLVTERPQAGRAATGPDGEKHSCDEASAGEPHAEAAPAAATGIDSVPLGDAPDQARAERVRLGDDLEEFR
jgi:single-strand DNA-binding protein